VDHPSPAGFLRFLAEVDIPGNGPDPRLHLEVIAPSQVDDLALQVAVSRPGVIKLKQDALDLMPLFETR
jgi:hypothetical protein